MKVVLQRVQSAAVAVDGETIASIERGALLLVGFGESDDGTVLGPVAKKIANMRIFPNAQGRFDRSLLDERLPALAVPQFTLFADLKKGRRPEFFSALKPELASPLFEQFVVTLSEVLSQEVPCGKFGADMQVQLVNDGPVTIIVDSNEL